MLPRDFGSVTSYSFIFSSFETKIRFNVYSSSIGVDFVVVVFFFCVILGVQTKMDGESGNVCMSNERVAVFFFTPLLPVYGSILI